MRRRSHGGRYEENARWVEPRPEYVRELEPLAIAWRSVPDPGMTEIMAREENRRLFELREAKQARRRPMGRYDPLEERERTG